jgi:hypothetical protein
MLTGTRRWKEKVVGTRKRRKADMGKSEGGDARVRIVIHRNWSGR